MRAIVLNPPRRRRERRRGRRRNPLYRSRSGRLTRRRTGRRVRRRRGRRRNYSHWIPAYRGHPTENPRKRRRRRKRRRNFRYFNRKRRRRRNPSWVPRYANAGLRDVTKAMAPGAIMGAVPIMLGAAANAWVSGRATALDITPDFLKTGVPNLLLSLATAGSLGIVGGMVSPDVGRKVVVGGVVQTVKRAYDMFIGGGPVDGLEGLHCVGDNCGCIGCGEGMADYLTTQQAATAQPLGLSVIDGVASMELATG